VVSGLEGVLEACIGDLLRSQANSEGSMPPSWEHVVLDAPGAIAGICSQSRSALRVHCARFSNNWKSASVVRAPSRGEVLVRARGRQICVGSCALPNKGRLHMTLDHFFDDSLLQA
jgi:hypothetical protein